MVEQKTFGRIVTAFNDLFVPGYQTELIGGANAPYYQPDYYQLDHVPDADSPPRHVIFFREDFVASALHEVAHWCLAGKARREIPDYGYWYEPVRDSRAQLKFEQIEVRPQALEWVFSVAAGIPFRVSVDNLELTDHDTRSFKSLVRAQAVEFITGGFNERARKFADALAGSAVDYVSCVHYQKLPD